MPKRAPQENRNLADKEKQRRIFLSAHFTPCDKVAHASGGYQLVATMRHHSTMAHAPYISP
jgi:hypothetical protein